MIFAKDRPELEAATRALDRVLLWGNYVVPQWYSPDDRIAYWDKYRRPDKLPSRPSSFAGSGGTTTPAAKELADARSSSGDGAMTQGFRPHLRLDSPASPYSAALAAALPLRRPASPNPATACPPSAS